MVGNSRTPLTESVQQTFVEKGNSYSARIKKMPHYSCFKKKKIIIIYCFFKMHSCILARLGELKRRKSILEVVHRSPKNHKTLHIQYTFPSVCLILSLGVEGVNLLLEKNPIQHPHQGTLPFSSDISQQCSASGFKGCQNPSQWFKGPNKMELLTHKAAGPSTSSCKASPVFSLSFVLESQ